MFIVNSVILYSIKLAIHLSVLLVFIAASCGKKNTGMDRDLIPKIDSLTLIQIDAYKLPTVSVASYDRLTDYAIRLGEDSINSGNNVKGVLVLTKISLHLSREIESNNLDPRSSHMKRLLKKFETRNYFIYQPKVPDFIKTAHHMCEGNYPYIWGRFQTKWYFYPEIILIGLFLVASFCSLFRVFKWKYRRRYNIFFCCLLISMIVLWITFKKTCNKYVTEDSFYGISI